MRGLEKIESLKFLNMSLNNVQKINQLKYIENLPLLTEIDFCVNPLQSQKYYKSTSSKKTQLEWKKSFLRVNPGCGYRWMA